MNRSKKWRRACIFAGVLLIIGGVPLYRGIEQCYCDQALKGAIRRGDRDAVAMLLASGANPNVRISLVRPVSPMTRVRRLFRLTDQGASDGPIMDPALSSCPEQVNGTDVYEFLPEDPIITEALLRAGANVDATDAFGQTALGWAVILGRTQTVRLLLEHGANPNTCIRLCYDLKIGRTGNRVRELLLNSDRMPVLQEALSRVKLRDGSADIARMLVLHGASHNVKGSPKLTPLMVAVLTGDRDAVQSLLKKGADVNARTRNEPKYEALSGPGYTPYRPNDTILGWLNQCQSYAGDTEMKRVLVEAGGKE